ncbi:MAG TPA: hypothetical protein VL485_28565 [Ktedonobacteraceae bacterium]|jgi:hypothetical protein|nr:hypothetical protein [Ktedonobacteraceae bacterium]
MNYYGARNGQCGTYPGFESLEGTEQVGGSALCLLNMHQPEKG